MKTRISVASAEVVIRPGLERRLSRRVRLDRMSGICNLTPWTWHPHLPGVTTSWLAVANGVSIRTIHRWRKHTDPVDADLSFLSAEIGLAMSLLRPARCLMPMWSRMAIAEYASQGVSYDDLSRMFQCGKSTVWRCVKKWPGGFAPLSGKRLLTKQQQSTIIC